MALEPVGSQKAFPHKASAESKNADASLYSEHTKQKSETQTRDGSVSLDHKKPARTLSTSGSEPVTIKQHDSALSEQAGTALQAGVLHCADHAQHAAASAKHAETVKQLGPTVKLEHTGRDTASALDTHTSSADIVAIADFKESLISVLKSCNLPVSPLAQKAVLLAMSEGLRLSPVLLRRILKALERGASSDELTLIKAFEYDDEHSFETAAALLSIWGKKNSVHKDTDYNNTEGQTSSEEHSSGLVVESELEEKKCIIEQLQALFSKQSVVLDGAGDNIGRLQEQHTQHKEKGTAEQTGARIIQKNFSNALAYSTAKKSDSLSHKTWIHVPFTYKQGFLNLTGTLRMIYNYITKKIERIVVACSDIHGERLAVLEAGRALVWTSSKEEQVSLERAGFTCLTSKADIEACAWCGINSIMNQNHEKRY